MDLSIPAIDMAWQKCEQILQHMTAFSVSARNTLQFLSTARAQVLSSKQSDSQQQSPDMGPANLHHSPAPDVPSEAPPHGTSGDDVGIGQLFNWDASMGGILGSDEMGFLRPFDFSDFQGWLPEETL